MEGHTPFVILKRKNLLNEKSATGIIVNILRKDG
jgi:hypothetical protein